MNTVGHTCKFGGKRCKRTVFLCQPVLVRYVALFVDIPVANEIKFDSPCLFFCYLDSFAVNDNNFTLEVFLRGFCGSFIKSIFDILLQILHKLFITIACNNGKDVYVVNFKPLNASVDSISCTVYAKTHSASDFLSFIYFAVALF